MRLVLPAFDRAKQRHHGWLAWGSWCCILAAVGALVLAAEPRAPAPGPELSRVAHVAQQTTAGDRELIASCAGADSAQSMVRVPAGSYQPFYKQGAGARTRRVDAFSLDRKPVSRGDFLAFVALRPSWRKSAVDALFAENAYLSDWRGDLDPGRDGRERPVTFVSWFAAKAYCECHDKRLPTVIEWEWAAGGEASSSEAKAGAPPFQFAMVKSSPERRSELQFAGVWEWTSDFNSVLISGRSDTGSGSSLFCGDGYRANDAKDYAGFLRHSFRASLKASYTLNHLGFRCARDAQ